MKTRIGLLTLLISLVVLVGTPVDGVGQVKKEPRVWLVLKETDSFGSIFSGEVAPAPDLGDQDPELEWMWNSPVYHPFVSTLKNSRYGDRLTIDSGWTKTRTQWRTGDVWIVVHTEEHNSDFHYNSGRQESSSVDISSFHESVIQTGLFINISLGYVDSLKNPVFVRSRYGFVKGDLKMWERSMYTLCNEVVKFIRDGMEPLKK